MPTPISNTYIEPTANMSLNYARSIYNDSLRAVLTNFRSPSAPLNQITIDGVQAGVQDGMLYRSTITNALYIADSVNYKGSSIGSNFTRWGIGHRVEPTQSAITTNINTYEIGELVATLDTGKLYIRTSNTNSSFGAAFTDIGAPQGFTVEAITSNATFAGQSLTALKMNAVSNVSVGTSSPTQSLDVRGGALITGILTSNVTVSNAYNIPGTAHFGPAWSNTSPSVHLGPRRFVDTSSSAGAVVPLRTSFSVLRPTFDSTNATVNMGSVSTLYIEGAPANTATNAIFGNAYAIHVAANGIYLSSAGSNTAPLVALNNPNTGFFAPTTTSISVATGGLTAATFSATGDFTAAGNITAYSDERLKSDIRTIDNALAKVSKMRGVYFNKDGQISTGVIAQEIEKVLPEVVYDGDFKSVAYGNIVGILIEAIKELQAKLEKLEGEV